jgi:hypothetical protein
MKTRLAAACGLVAVALALVAAPAGAHEEINPKVASTGTPTFFTLSVANEEKTDLVKVEVDAPDLAPFGATTRQPADWTAALSGESKITYTGGAIKPDNFENFGFETDGIKQAGNMQYKVIMTWSDGKTETVNPPPVVASAPGSTTATKSSGSSNKATVALVLAIIALVAGLAALGLALSRRGGSQPATPEDRAAASTW